MTLRLVSAGLLLAATAALIPAVDGPAEARATPADACQRGTVGGEVLRTLFAAINSGKVARAARLLSTPPDFPESRRWHVALTFRDGKQVLRRERIDVDDAAAKRRWLRQRIQQSEQLRLLDVEVGDAATRPSQRMYPGLLIERRADDLSETLFYGGKAGVDCKRRKIIFIFAGARRGVGPAPADAAS